MQIKDVTLKIGSGATPTGGCKSYKSSGISLIRSQNVLDMSFTTEGLAYIDEQQAQRLAGVTVCENDVLLNITGDSIARCCIVPKEILPARVNQHVSIIRASKTSPHYLLYFLQFLKPHLMQICKVGGTRNALTKEAIEKLPFWEVDNPDEVASILNTINGKIQNNNAISADLEAMAKLLYDYWFVQFDFPDENGKPYKSSGGKMVWNEKLKREIPEGWEVKEIGDFIATERGISYSTPNISTGKGVPMLNLATFTPGSGGYKAGGLKYFLGEYPKNKILKPYDLIMCNTQQTAIRFETDIIGRAMLVPDFFDGDVVFSHHVNVIKPTEESLRVFLLYLFNSDHFHRYISGYTNGTNILGLSFVGINKYKSEIPPSKILDDFASIILAKEKQKNNLELENQRLTHLRDSLLPMLMNGQVTIE